MKKEKALKVLKKIRDRVSNIQLYDLDIEDVVLEIDEEIDNLEKNEK